MAENLGYGITPLELPVPTDGGHRMQIRQQGRIRPTGSMLRTPFVSTRQPSTSRFGPRRLAFSYPHARLSQAGERTRGIHADGRRSVRMRSPAWSGRIGSWLERAMSLRRAGTFSPVHAVFSHSPETCSMAFLTAYRQSHHKHCGNTPKTVPEGVWKAFSSITHQVCLRIGENAIRAHPSNTTVQNTLNPTVKRAESLSSCDWA